MHNMSIVKPEDGVVAEIFGHVHIYCRVLDQIILIWGDIFDMSTFPKKFHALHTSDTLNTTDA